MLHPSPTKVRTLVEKKLTPGVKDTLSKAKSKKLKEKADRKWSVETKVKKAFVAWKIQQL